MRFKIKLSKENFYVFFSFLYFSINHISRMLGIIGIPRELSYALFFFFFLIFVLITVKSIKIYDILILIAISVPAVIGLINYSRYIESNSNIIAVLLLYIPAYYFFRLCPTTCIVKGLGSSINYSALFLLYEYFTRIRFNYMYNMSYAYWIIVPICGLFYIFLKRRRFICLIISIICFITLVISGSRGALLLCVICMFLFYAFHNNLSKNKTIRWGVFVTILLSVYMNIDILLGKIEAYSSVSRNIRKLLSGQFFTYDNRSLLYNICKNLINAKPFGYGPLASRKLITQYPYPHSIIYELQLDYGKYIGLFLLVLIVFMAIYVIWSNRKNDTLMLSGIVCIIGIGSLFVSSSYYNEFDVPAVIALFVSTTQNYRCQKTRDSFC